MSDQCDVCRAPHSPRAVPWGACVAAALWVLAGALWIIVGAVSLAQ